MLVSVIIPTYNGLYKLPYIWDALLNQTSNDFELIISIDGSTDGTIEYVNKRQNDFFKLIILNNENTGRAKCRNRGALAASGDILIFLDDDMRPIEKLVELHLQKYKENTIVVGAQIEENVKCKSDIQLYKAFLSRKWSDFGSNKLETPYITAANFSISKSLFMELGMFDERLTDAEDFDLAVRAFEKKIDIFYYPELLAWHDDFITCKSYIKRLKEYDKAQEKLIILKPELFLKKYSFRKKNNLLGFKKYAYKFFSNQLWVKLIDLNFFAFLPKFLKYRIYDYVITAKGVYRF